MEKARRPRLHVIAAKEAPVAVILRRQPSKTWHVIKWDLQSGKLYPGSWFDGKLYPLRCDISWDGSLFAYLAMGANGRAVWNGVCRLPYLKTIAEWDNGGATYNGGGVWLERGTLYRNLLTNSEVKFAAEWQKDTMFDVLDAPQSEDLGTIFFRLRRDGFLPAGSLKFLDPMTKSHGSLRLDLASMKLPWECPRGRVSLRAEYVGYRSAPGDGDEDISRDPEYEHRTGYSFRFDVPERPGLLGPCIEWATWAANSDLLYVVDGSAHRVRFEGAGQPRTIQTLDLNLITRPTGT